MSVLEFTREVKSAHTAFGKYFEDNYTYTSDRWLRREYLARFPVDMHDYIPTGTQIGESGFSGIKGIDLAE